MVLDRIDFGILRLLQNDASLSNKEVAAAIGLAPSSAHERLKRLRQEGILRGFHADVDRPPLKWSTVSYVFCSKEGRDAEEDLQAGRDRREAAAG
jgi:DNA-binding Lrp family transcriptional regulator